MIVSLNIFTSEFLLCPLSLTQSLSHSSHTARSTLWSPAFPCTPLKPCCKKKKRKKNSGFDSPGACACCRSSGRAPADNGRREKGTKKRCCRKTRQPASSSPADRQTDRQIDRQAETDSVRAEQREGEAEEEDRWVLLDERRQGSSGSPRDVFVLFKWHFYEFPSAAHTWFNPFHACLGLTRARQGRNWMLYNNDDVQLLLCVCGGGLLNLCWGQSGGSQSGVRGLPGAADGVRRRKEGKSFIFSLIPTISDSSRQCIHCVW